MQPNDSLKFATYTRDAATGLDYADQRYYASNFGRMMSPDPYEASIGSEDPGSWNRYSYTRADPINRLDPAGLSDTCPDCIASVTAYSFQDTVGSGSGAPLGTNWAWVAMNFADTKGQPPLPILEGANQKQNSAFQKAVALALKLLQKKDGKCASFFGGLQNAIDELVGANYQFDITNALAAAGSGAAAQTDSADNSVTISTLGPFFAQYQTVNGSTSNYGASLGLNGTNFQAFILLHELGHLTGAYGSTDNDGTNTAISKANQIANNTAVLKDCFNKDFNPNP
jgi:RHS repeat-associated protein